MISMDYKSYVPNISFNGCSSKYKPDKSVADTEITQVDYSSNKKSATDNVYSPGNSIKPGNMLERRNSDESTGASADKAEVVKDNKSIAGETENIDSNASTTRTQLEQLHPGSKYGNGQLDLNFINSNKKSQVITISEIITLAKENEEKSEADKKTTTTYAFDVKTPSSKAKSTAGTADKINPSMDSTLSTPLSENFSYFLFEENKNIEIISDPLPVFKKTTTVGNKQEDSAKQSTPEQENVIPFYIYKSKHSIKIGSGLVLQTELKNHISLDFNTSDDFETLSNLFLNSFEKTVTAENKTVDLAHLKSLALNNVPPVNYIGMSTFGAGSTSFSNGVVYCNVRDDLFT
ncbi:hypothetical protein AX774_g7713 [Zancudomyces culisetae]|uniref:Uncharacterized protein n=1 Tax=Zancudomyces culisetae TaxID=1213189 RepID=A0A1R1PD22_ZANCU|nr:hypothetical protein AX774_g7713 [Zancudomyces culisetae]|eukprot:OMH78884.1 hypothetical protein AX774_g7713 [Zancudomyces culisetae]